MRVLYHHRTSGEEPESVHIANIVMALRKLGHTVEIVGPAPLGSARRPQKPGALARLKSRLPRALRELAMLAYNARSTSQIAQALRRRPYDFIYERYALNNIAGLLAARIFRLPIVLEVNTPYAEAWSKYYGLSFGGIARAIEQFLFRRVDGIITVTDVQRRALEARGVEPERIHVSHNAIDPAEFDGELPYEGSLRQGTAPGTLIAGFVGTMNRWQGVQGFAEVIGRVEAAGGGVLFVFVGDGEGRAPLEAELARANLQHAAKFLGRQPHGRIPALVAQFDMGLLLDSNAYGSPMKVFEYWAMRKAVIAPSVEPVREILEDGRTGLMIEPGSAAQMADAILRLRESPELRESLGDAAHRHVLATHTWTRNAETIIAAYSRAAGARMLTPGEAR